MRDTIDTGQEVWTLVYDHGHGQDLSVYADEKSVFIAAVDLILEYAKSFGHGQEQVDEMISLAIEHPDEAISEWGDYTGSNEFLTVDCQQVYAYEDTIDVMANSIADAEEKTDV